MGFRCPSKTKKLSVYLAVAILHWQCARKYDTLTCSSTCLNWLTSTLELLGMTLLRVRILLINLFNSLLYTNSDVLQLSLYLRNYAMYRNYLLYNLYNMIII